MADESKCTDCGQLLRGADYLATLDKRKPCPNCGSMARIIEARGSAISTSTASLNATLEDVTATATATVAWPAVMLTAIVEARGVVPDGELIVTIGPAWDAILAALTTDPNALRQLDPRQLEELIAASYERAGFEDVVLTPRSGDRGRDVIATRRGLYTVRILDQVKAYAPGNLVPADDVRALLGVLLRDPAASKGFVTTTSDFAPGCASEFAAEIPTRLELVNGPSLVKRLAAIAAGAKL